MKTSPPDAFEWRRIKKTIERRERFQVILFLLSVAAGAFPMVQLPAGGWRCGLGWTTWTASVAFLFFLFRRIGEGSHTIRSWVLDSPAGTVCVSFLATAAASAVSLTMALMKLPAWLVLSYATLFACAVLGIILRWVAP